jgi:hypothetical protein
MLEGKDYCPLLHARISEIKALVHLPAPTKDLIFPLIVARPWPNAKHLVRTWEKIGEALGDRRFALDLDRERFGQVTARPANSEFNSLFDESGAYQNYYDQVAQLEHAVPVLRVDGTGLKHLARQLDHIDEIERGFVLRVEHGFLQNPIGTIEAVLAARKDFVLLIDAGWIRDLLSREAWASQILQRVSDLAQDLEIVVCGSSFPDQFTNIQRRGEIAAHERAMYANLVRRHNAVTLMYGDWASTRPPRESTPMKFVARIDLPTDQSWICFRSDDDETFSEIANRLLVDSAWPAKLKIWGTYIIEATATEQPQSIKSPATAASARINIHMHRQAHFGATPASDEDEPYTDD